MRMNQEELKKHIPHRPPFLFLDGILDMTEGRIVAVKKLSGNEDFFLGHFPGDPVFPQVFMLETVAQAAAVYASIYFHLKDKIIVISGIEHVAFSERRAKPGDTLKIEVDLLRFGGRVARIRGRVFDEGEQLMDAVIVAVVI